MSETEASPAQDETQPKVEVDFSRGLGGFLRRAGIALAFTSYQSGRLYLVGHAEDGKLAMHEAHYPQAMGVVGDANRIYLGTLTQLVRLENVLAPGQLANAKHDRLYVPRNLQTFGNVDFHELGIRDSGAVVVVNTRFSCLCEPSLTHSFKPIWKPAFISRLAPEDRCHLNGLAMVDGRPKFVTAVSRSDTVDGWRDRRGDGGIVIDIESDEIICEGLSMPHSPRWHRGELWLLNSGTGELGRVNFERRKFEPLAFLPGFLRGLALVGDYAIVGLSKPRHGRFEGLELDHRLVEKDTEAWCGLQVVSLETGNVVEWMRLGGPMTELFAVTALPGVANPITIGLQTKEIEELITWESPTWDE